MSISPDLFSTDLAIKCLNNSKDLLILNDFLSARSLSHKEPLFEKNSEYSGRELMWLIPWYFSAGISYNVETKEKAWEFIEKIKQDGINLIEKQQNYGMNYSSIAMLLNILIN